MQPLFNTLLKRSVFRELVTPPLFEEFRMRGSWTVSTFTTPWYPCTYQQILSRWYGASDTIDEHEPRQITRGDEVFVRNLGLVVWAEM